MSEKKPSELVVTNIDLGGGFSRVDFSVVGLCRYLDDEQERRQKFEQDLMQRVWALEAANPEVRTAIGTTDSGAVVHGVGRYEPESDE